MWEVIGMISVFLVYRESRVYRRRRQHLVQGRSLRMAYDQAKLSGDISRALLAGVAYYTFLRKGAITRRDGWTIIDDLNAML